MLDPILWVDLRCKLALRDQPVQHWWWHWAEIRVKIYHMGIKALSSKAFID